MLGPPRPFYGRFAPSEDLGSCVVVICSCLSTVIITYGSNYYSNLTFFSEVHKSGAPPSHAGVYPSNNAVNVIINMARELRMHIQTSEADTAARMRYDCRMVHLESDR